MESAEALPSKSPVSEVRRREMRDKYIRRIHNDYTQWLMARPTGERPISFHDWLQMEVPWEPILEKVTATSPAHPETERRIERFIRSQIKHLELAVKMFSHSTDPVWDGAFKASGLELGAIVFEFCEDLREGRVHGPEGRPPAVSQSPGSVSSQDSLTTP